MYISLFNKYNLSYYNLLIIFFIVFFIKKTNITINLIINLFIVAGGLYYFYDYNSNIKQTKNKILNRINSTQDTLDNITNKNILNTENSENSKNTETNKVTIDNIDYSEPIFNNITKLTEYTKYNKESIKECINLINSFYKNINSDNINYQILSKCSFIIEKIREYLTFPLTTIEPDQSSDYIKLIKEIYIDVNTKFEEKNNLYKELQPINILNNPIQKYKELPYYDLKNNVNNNLVY